MRASLDNDFLYKLARFDLLSAFDALLVTKGFQRPWYCLPSGRFVLKVYKKPAIDRWPNADQQGSLRKFFRNQCISVPTASTTTLGRLNVPGIDAGELLLFSHAVENPGIFVFTGDKVALRSLASDPSLAGDASILAARAVHVEAVVQALLPAIGCAQMRTSIVANPVDRALSQVFGHAGDVDAQIALVASIEKLRRETGGLLVPAF